MSCPSSLHTSQIHIFLLWNPVTLVKNVYWMLIMLTSIWLIAQNLNAFLYTVFMLFMLYDSLVFSLKKLEDKYGFWHRVAVGILVKLNKMWTFITREQLEYSCSQSFFQAIPIKKSTMFIYNCFELKHYILCSIRFIFVWSEYNFIFIELNMEVKMNNHWFEYFWNI